LVYRGRICSCAYTPTLRTHTSHTHHPYTTRPTSILRLKDHVLLLKIIKILWDSVDDRHVTISLRLQIREAPEYIVEASSDERREAQLGLVRFLRNEPNPPGMSWASFNPVKHEK
jgi:hypothetical protein